MAGGYKLAGLIALDGALSAVRVVTNATRGCAGALTVGLDQLDDWALRARAQAVLAAERQARARAAFFEGTAELEELELYGGYADDPKYLPLPVEDLED